MPIAAYIDENGGPEVFAIRDHPLPPPGAGELRVRNTAIGLNFIDIYQRKGLYPLSMPAILGSEAAGVVDSVGDNSTGFEPGDRVVYLSSGGAYASETNVSAAMAAKIPDSVSDEQAAASFLKGLTAEMLLRQVFRLTAEHTCLIYAASGGVGTLLCQWAHHIGARIIAVVGNSEKAELARKNGADEIIIRTETDSISNDVRKLTNSRGVDVVYDSVGEATFEASLNSLALRGHMVSFGNASGPVPAVQPLDLSRRGSLSLTRPSLFHYATPDRLPEMAMSLFSMIESGAVAPSIGLRYTLSDIAEAHRQLESGSTTGAIIVTP